MEEDLKRALGRASRSDFQGYDPFDLMLAVNKLFSMGADGALDAVQSYLRSAEVEADPCQGFFLLLRVLFEVPENPGYHLPMRIGMPSPPPPRDLRDLPRFPIVMVEDVPLLAVSGYLLGGLPEPVEAHLDHFRRTGVLRARPLQVPNSIKKSLEARLLQGYLSRYRIAYETDPSDTELAFVRGQLERMEGGAGLGF